MKRRWFLFFLMKSVSQRKGRIIIASASVTLAVAVVIAMIAITAGIRDKLGEEIRAYGANIIVSPAEGEYLDNTVVAAVERLRYVEDAEGQLFGSASVRRHAVEVIGLDTARLKGWRLYGSLPGKKGEALAGSNLRDVLNLRIGEKIRLEGGESGGAGREFIVSGFIERGGPEDNAFLLSLQDASELFGCEGKLSAVLVTARPGEVQGVVESIGRILPAVSARTLRQVALPEESLLRKVQLLMTLVGVVALFSAAVSVAGTMGANVLERREEIGLMKAMGAVRGDVSLFFRAEAALIGLTGGFVGLILGILSAEAVSKGAFNSFIPVPLYLPFFAAAIGLALSALASYFPVRDAMKYSPAVILKGE